MTNNKKSAEDSSLDSMAEATRSRSEFSGHGASLGAAGKREVSIDPDNSEFLREPGQAIAISPGADGFDNLLIGVEWDNIAANQKQGFFQKIFGAKQSKGVDVDLGCLYELEDGSRGAIQAFGEKFGTYDSAPYIALSGDERTGDADGHDEYMLVNGAHWTKIKRLLVYLYIYKGAPNWQALNPKVIIDVPGEEDLIVTLGAYEDHLALCAVGGIEQVRGGIKLTNYTEYFPGHYEMDRAFGFGLKWDEGQKCPI